MLVAVDRNVVEVHHYRQAAVARLTLEDGLHHELEMCGRLRQAHRHPQPAVLPTVRREHRVVGRLVLEWYVVVPGLEIYHADPFGAAKICAIMLHIVQLIVVLVRSLIDGYNVLVDLIGLSRLHSRDQQQQCYAPGLLVR